jgi:hypothetical protein
MREAGAPSTEEVAMLSGCTRPPGAVMVAPPEVPRNAERAQSEGRPKEGSTMRGHGHYRGRSLKAPARSGVLEEPQ